MAQESHVEALFIWGGSGSVQYAELFHLGWIDFNLFSWYGEKFSQTYVPIFFSIQTSTTFDSAETRIQKKLADLAGLALVNSVDTEILSRRPLNLTEQETDFVWTGLAHISWECSGLISIRVLIIMGSKKLGHPSLLGWSNSYKKPLVYYNMQNHSLRGATKSFEGGDFSHKTG